MPMPNAQPTTLVEQIAAMRQENAAKPPPPNDRDAAVAQAKQQYPRIADLPLALSVGRGPFMSETFQPDDPQNPLPGKLNVELRNPGVIADKSKWPDYVALEAIHGLQATDPQYQQFTKQFVQSMTQPQLADAKTRYQKLQQDGFGGSYEDYLHDVQAQEYIRGMVFTKAIPNWIGPKGEGKYTPQQLQLGQQITRYLKTPKGQR